VADDAIERVDRQNSGGGSAVSRRPLIFSFATDGELSTFSNDSDDSATDGVRRYAVHRRPSPQSIFRPVSAMKRHCDFSDDERERKRCSSAPPLCHANPVWSTDDVCDSGESDSDMPPPMIATSHSFASPFKRVRRGSGNSFIATPSSGIGGSFNAASPSTSLFAASVSLIEDAEGNTGAFSIAPRRSSHPPSFRATPLLRATSIMNAEDEGN